MHGDVVFVNNSRETFTSTASGAIATCIWETCRAAAEAGETPVVVTRAHPSKHEELEWARVTTLPAILPSPGAVRTAVRRARRRATGWARPDQWQYAAQLGNVLQRSRPRLAIVNNDPELAVYLRKRLPDTRVVHWFHNLEMSSDRYRRAFARDTELRAVAVSRYLARAVEQLYGMATFAVDVVPNGVDSKRFYVADRPQRVPVVGFLGRIAVEKGPDVLLRSAHILAQRGMEFGVQLVGDTNWAATNENPYSREVRKLADSLEEAGVTVRRLGHVPRAEIPAALAGSDIHVMPSRWDEPFGLALLEGMASGQAVVASAVGGIPEVLDGAGALVPRDDPRAMADALQRLITDASARARSARAARERAEQLTWARTWERLRETAGD